MEFKKLFRKKIEEEPVVPQTTPKKLEMPKEYLGKDGKRYLEINYYNEKSKFGQFYDTTRLIVNEEPSYVANSPIYHAKVSWYGMDDTCFFDNGCESYRATDTRDILLGLDFGKLQDFDYLDLLMTQLLEKARVERYLQNGLQENVNQPCGNYVGAVGISKQTGNYVKEFNLAVGEAVHHSPEMVEARRIQRKELEKRRAAERAILDNRIAQLQRERNNL